MSAEMSEEVTRIYAENLMFEMKRPCMTPVDVKLSTGGITKHCCWTCYNCKTARGITVDIVSSTVDTISEAIENRHNKCQALSALPEGTDCECLEFLALIKMVTK